MMVRSNCDCLVCRLETSLIAELNDERSREQFRLLSASSPILSSFASAFDLIGHLHRDHQQHSSSDSVLFEILARIGDTAFAPVGQSLLLLVFIPTIHRTTSQITASFASLARDDAAQSLFAVLLEFLRSKELESRRSHIAFTIARKIRRNAFRWAIRESRKSLRNETRGTYATPVEAEAPEDSHSLEVLDQFLDRCQRRGWLSYAERRLLTQFKIERISASELARRSGLSAVAIRHRVQRILARLRRIARKSEVSRPEQLDLFAR
jgi:DNA-directed RNA polymerase specialized sigma24 family protein